MMNLDELRVQSFVTSSGEAVSKTVRGGFTGNCTNADGCEDTDICGPGPTDDCNPDVTFNCIDTQQNCGSMSPCWQF